MLVDTHCHLDASYFPEGADAVLSRAHEAGVGAFVCVGVGSAEAAESALALARRRSDVVATVGVHPHDAATWGDELERTLTPLIGEERVVALGEMGLDYHCTAPRSPRDVVSV